MIILLDLELVDAFIKHWIAIFGAPGTIFSDNGGEFSNDLFHDLGEQFNINVKTTPVKSPWSNGIVERHNSVLGKIVNKLILDENNKYPIDVIVAWAVSAKNALILVMATVPINLFLERTLIFHQI